MEGELDIIDSLNALAYGGDCKELTKMVDGGIRSEEFRKLVGWLTQELHVLRKTDEQVSELNDINEFAIELSAMLKELGCPYSQFVTGALSERFQSREALLHLLEYLVTELMATKMSLRIRPAAQKAYVIPKCETNTARALEELTRELSLGKPPENISPKALFDKLNFKVEERLRQVKADVVSEPLLRTPKPLTDAQWKKLESIHDDLNAEYNLRRQVLLTRLEVTIQSFQWSDSMRARENEITTRFQKKLQELESLKYCGEETNIVTMLAARADLAIIEKTSSANVRKNTGSKIQKHVIGRVPDRGGRAYEHAPPPPEMPSWQQQRVGGPMGRGGGRGGAVGGGGPRGGGGRGGLPFTPQFTPQYNQPYNQRPQFEQGQARNQNWISGSGRVQDSGWSQKSNDFGNNSNSNFQGSNRDNSGNFRGRSNYNRGGQRR